MGLGRNIALAKLDPAKSRTERMMRDDQRMAQMSDQYYKDQQVEAQFRAEQDARDKDFDAKLKEIAPQDQARVVASLQTQRQEIKDGLAKVGGDHARFMRQGGAAKIQAYQDAVLNNEALAISRNNAREKAKLEAYEQQGLPISKKSRLQYQQWQAGKTDRFQITALEDINTLELSQNYYTDETIPTQEILKAYRNEITTNYLIENELNPGDEIDEGLLLNFTKQNYGQVRGRKTPTAGSSATGSGSSRSSSSGNAKSASDGINVTKWGVTSTSLSTINRNQQSNDGSSLRISYKEKDSLKKVLKDTGLVSQGLVNISQQNLSYNKEGMRLHEGYVMQNVSADELISGTKSGYFNAETGKYRVVVGGTNVYNSNGEQGLNADGEAVNIPTELTLGNVVITKVAQSLLLEGEDKDGKQARNMIIMEYEDKDVNQQLSDRMDQNAAMRNGDIELSAKVMVEAYDDDGNMYYIEVPDGPATVAGIDNAMGESGVLNDAYQQEALLTAPEKKELAKQSARNRVKKEDYFNSFKSVSTFTAKHDYEVDPYTIMPLANMLTDNLLANYQATREDGYVVTPEDRQQIMETQTFKIINAMAAEDDLLLAALYGYENNAKQVITDFVNTNMKDKIEDYKYYFNL